VRALDTELSNVTCGKAMNRLRERSRLLTVVLYGASAAVVALLTRSVLSSTAAVFFPAIGHHAAAAIVFVVQLVPTRERLGHDHRTSAHGNYKRTQIEHRSFWEG
jgi:hypothetical protein